jgi:peroxiredoxin
MMRGWIGAAIVACVAACGAQPSAPAATGDVRVGSAAPDFVAKDLAGNARRLADYRGKVVLIDFWSTYCEPCKEEFPHIEALYRAKRDRGLEVIAVSMDDSDAASEVAKIAQRFGLEFPIVIDDGSQISRAYDPGRKAPLVVLVGRTGEVLDVRSGYSPGDETSLAEAVDHALDG